MLMQQKGALGDAELAQTARGTDSELETHTGERRRETVCTVVCAEAFTLSICKHSLPKGESDRQEKVLGGRVGDGVYPRPMVSA